MDANSTKLSADVMRIEVSLPDGSIVDINTKEGANAFLEGESAFDFFSSNLKAIRELRKKKRLNAGEEEKLERHFDFLNSLAVNADRETFDAKIPESEIQDSLDYIIDEVRSFTEKRHWISTGRLNHNDYKVLHFCANMLNGYEVPVYLAFKSDFFLVLANFIKARKEHGGRALPHVAICGPIGRIAYCAVQTVRHFDKNPWTLEKTFKKFEASGILEEILRCATVPEPVRLGPENYLESQDLVYNVLEFLQSCPSILTRKFKSGKPCGDTLKAILDGRDGSRSIQPRILNRLQDIARLVETMDTTKVKAMLQVGFCFNCHKTGDAETRLSVCSGCRFAQYCSKECQLAHWKRHKLICQSEKKSDRDRDATHVMAVLNFLSQNSETVSRALNERCDSIGVESSDLAVEVDFMPNENGIIPAFHDPPMFRIVLTRDYISGKEIPEWLRSDRVADPELERARFKDYVKQRMAESTSTFALVSNHGGDYKITPDFLPTDVEAFFKSETMDTTKVKANLDVGICFNCQKTGDAETRLSVCSGCRFVQYCSKECQLAHWKSHKNICQIIA